MSPRTPFHRRVFWISLLVLPLLFCRGIDAQPCPEVLDENHLGPGTITIPGFVAGEEGAVVFEAPAADCPIEILCGPDPTADGLDCLIEPDCT